MASLSTSPPWFVIATSRGRQPEHGLGCAWDDPGLGIRWPSRHARLSPRDAALPSLAELRLALDALAPSEGPVRAGPTPPYSEK